MDIEVSDMTNADWMAENFTIAEHMELLSTCITCVFQGHDCQGMDCSEGRRYWLNAEHEDKITPDMYRKAVQRTLERIRRHDNRKIHKEH